MQALLDSGALPSVSIAEFDEKVASDGGCDAFGYDSSATYFKVPKKTPRILVRCQKPTADNDYTWYNLYADGWVEQGGNWSITASTSWDPSNNPVKTITFPITMATNKYAISQARTPSNGLLQENLYDSFTTTSMRAGAYCTGSGTAVSGSWQIAGYADPAEYTKDKWDYQNVHVERPMVQLFNGATDEAVATCTEVLADVAGLKQTTDGMIDYVVESQEPTEANGYTWYRLYKSGWVEQGGSVPVSGNKGQLVGVIELPIPMQPDKATQPFAAYKYLSGQSYTVVATYYNSSRTNVTATVQTMGTTIQSSGTITVMANGYAVQ